MGIRNDRTTSELSEKVRAHKPAGLTDACWREPEALLSEAEREPATDASRQRLEQPQSYQAAESAHALSPSALRGTLPEPRWRMMSLPVICVLPIAMTTQSSSARLNLRN